MSSKPGLPTEVANGPTLADASDQPTADSPRRSSTPPANPQPAVELPKAIGRYTVQRVLGSGAFGSVYLAHDSELNRLVALKVPRPDRFSGPEQIEQFIAEARTAAQLRHPRIVAVHDIDRQPDGTPVVILDYIDGPTLKSVLDSQALTPRCAAELMAEIADAVAEAHRKGFVHRDLKPANVLLDSGGKPHVADFGLALHEDVQRERRGEFAGTIAYMAPEQVRAESHRLDGRADIWALGVILYQMLTGRLPFGGSSTRQLSDEIQHREPKPPRQIDASLPVELEAIITRCCAKKIGDRYSTASDIAADLRAWLASSDRSSAPGVPVSAERPSPAPSRSMSVNASCGVVSLAFTATLALMGMVVFGLQTRPMPDAGQVTALPMPPLPAPPAGLRIEAIELKHFARTADGDVFKGMLGQDSFSAALGDSVQVTARLSKPAYAYLIAFRPDAPPDLCFPESEDIPPPLSDAPSYPSTNRLEAYELAEGAGLWAFTVIASEKPLPPYKEIKEQIERHTAWKPIRELPRNMAWWDDGQSLKELTPAGIGNVTRGKGATLRGPTEAIVQLTEALRALSLADSTSTLAFAVMAAK
jgi:hypothetical protein